MTTIRTAREVAAMIDADPGIFETALITALNPSSHHIRRRNFSGLAPMLRSMGYRDGQYFIDSSGSRPWCWWPSAVRCAELAREATGEYREALLRGMWL